MPEHIRQAAFEAVVVEREALVIETHEVEDDFGFDTLWRKAPEQCVASIGVESIFARGVPWASMSGVLKSGLVNMSSQWMDTAFGLKGMI
jgi:hypothetical protein